MPTESFFIVVGSRSADRHCRIVEESELDSYLATFEDYRFSPIFSLNSSYRAEQICGVSFYTVENAFSNLGTLAEQVDDEVTNRLWFGYGLTSVIQVHRTEEEQAAVFRVLEKDLRALERWDLNEGIIANTSIRYFGDPVDVENCKVVVRRGLTASPELMQLISSIRCGIDNAVVRSAKLAPQLIQTFVSLAASVNELSEELERNFGKGSLEQRQRQNTIVDYLIQIDSVLAYVMSQAFGGATPILESLPFVHSHSLLGTGSAILGINAFLEHIRGAFSQAAVVSLVKHSFSQSLAVPVPRRIAPIDRDGADDYLVDVLSREGLLHDDRPLMLFFSGRLGFQEAPFSISAAIQAIQNADSVLWSVLTLSHEYLHSHVRDLLAAVVCNEQDAEAAYEIEFENFQAFVNGTFAPANAMQSVRFGVFNYCRLRESLDSGRHNAVSEVKRVAIPGDVNRIDRSHLRLLFTHYWRDINEMIVHTLDFRYFYGMDIELYVDYLWGSWSTVPSVLADPEHYMLRTIAAISTCLHGSHSDRFDRACEIIRERIVRLQETGDENVLFQDCLARLEGDNKLASLKMASLANQYLADIVVNTLFSSKLNAALTRDDLLEPVGEKVRFQLETGEFLSHGIQSPVSFLIDRLRRENAAESTTIPQASKRSAWLYLVLASTGGENRV